MLRPLWRSFGLLREAIREFFRDGCPRLAAALSFYSLFWLPAMFVLLIAAAGSISERTTVEDYLIAQISGWTGARAAAVVRGVIDAIVATPFPGGSTTVGVASLLVGATGALAQIQAALDRAWGVPPSRRRKWVARVLGRRLLALLVLLVLWAVLMLSLALRTTLTGAGDFLERWLPPGRTSEVLLWLDDAVTLGASTVACAVLFRILPDARVRWRHVWAGAFVAALLFTAGKTLVGSVLGRRGFMLVYGPAGSLALVLVWVYYSALAVLFGAELAHVWARRHGG